ncbi:MAG: alpha/beta hydrolase [Propionibacteriaceae bacterium]|jgi:pimeloyl-ACP methyl ester carboxylesterase|nr:alpha/beta hydrolase [Propionibacteriaceae bacterium]
MSGYYVPGFYVEDRQTAVPLDWSGVQPGAAFGGETIDVFWREVCAPENRNVELPLLVFLQGGPGGKSPRPTNSIPWLVEAVKHFRVILPDQRGTGRSTPALADGRCNTAWYLSKLLADSIVRDFEHIRLSVYGAKRWTSLGQSYGGFLTLAYLSAFPGALNACLVTGGIPGVPPSAAEVYRRTFPRAQAKTEKLYSRYPQDAEITAAVADRLAEGDIVLPDGSPLSVERFQLSIGSDLGVDGGHEAAHWALDEAFARPGVLSATFLQEVYTRTAHTENPLFWTLQEFIYGSGDNGPIGWAAAAERARRPQFKPTARPLMATTEMTFPWMFEQITALRPYREAVDELMSREEWPIIYDEQRLARNETPVQAAVYFDDVYVDCGLQMDTLAKLGNSQYWVTNEHEHNGVRSSPDIFNRLYRLLNERGAFSKE